MPKKKIALVDIDNCLVQENGELNLALVEKLRGYDEVILFTQRSIYMQVGTIRMSFSMNKDELRKKDYLITETLIQALEQHGITGVKVSTSVDRFFGKATSYYDWPDGLKKIEPRTKATAEEEAPDDVRQAHDREVAAVANVLNPLDRRRPENFYPTGKVEQYSHLYSTKLFPEKGDRELEIDYYDDNNHNLTELQQASDDAVPVKPRLFIVSGICIANKASFDELFPGRDTKSKPLNSQERMNLAQHDMSHEITKYMLKQKGLAAESFLTSKDSKLLTRTIEFSNEIVRLYRDREQLFTKTKKSYYSHTFFGTKLGEWFGGSKAEDKISFYQQMMSALCGNEVKFTFHELDASQNGQTAKLLKKYQDVLPNTYKAQLQDMTVEIHRDMGPDF